MPPRYLLPMIVLVSLAGMTAAHAQVTQGETLTYPDTRAGTIAQAWIDALNTGEADLMRAFEEAYRATTVPGERSIEERIARAQELHVRVGELQPHRILSEDAEHLAMLARAIGIDQWLELRFELEPSPPHKVIRIRIRPVTPPELADRTYDAWNDLADLVTQARDDARVPAMAVAVAHADGEIDVAATGVRAFGGTDAVTTDDLFHIGSVTKSMTAVVIAALVQRGKLDWDTTLADAFPEIEMLAVYRDVTIDQLLTHRAGIRPYTSFDDSQLSDYLGLPGSPTEQRAAFVAEALAVEPVEPPGTEMHYSNAGYAIAGFIAERATGQPWRELMREHVFVPAGMSSAGFDWPASPDRPDEPRGHRNDGNTFIVEPLDSSYRIGAFMAPAGDVHCSVGDLARYGRMHLRGLAGQDGTLTADTVAYLHTPPPDAAGDAAGDAPYAAGWLISHGGDGDGNTVHWHNGSAGTFFAYLAIYPEHDLVIATVTNGVTPSIEPIVRRMNTAIAERITPSTTDAPDPGS